MSEIDFEIRHFHIILLAHFFYLQNFIFDDRGGLDAFYLTVHLHSLHSVSIYPTVMNILVFDIVLHLNCIFG